MWRSHLYGEVPGMGAGAMRALLTDEYVRLMTAREAPTPKKLLDSVMHLVPERHAVASAQRRIALEKLTAMRMVQGRAVSFIDTECIFADMHDGRDPADKLASSVRFVEIVKAGYKGVNLRATGLDNLVSATPAEHDYRTFLMHFAMSEGWVMQHGKYDFWGAADARKEFAQYKIAQPMLYNYQQFRHIGGVDGIGAGILAHALGMLAWRNAGHRSDDEDMIYYGHGTQSPHVSGRQGRTPSAGDDSAGHEETDNETGYLQWADRLDVEDAPEDTDEETESEPVNEDAEAAGWLFVSAEHRQHRLISEVVAASSNATSIEARPGNRGPAVTSAGGAGSVARNAAQPVDAAVAARVRLQERRILELNQTIERLEGTRAAAAREAASRNVPRSARAREDDADPPPATRQRVSPPHGVNTDTRRNTRSPLVAQAIAREIRQSHAGSRATPAILDWGDNLEQGNKMIPTLEDGFKGVVEDSISILAYDTNVVVMNFWVPPALAEWCVARALKLTSPRELTLLHMIWGVDEKRVAWFTRRMQVWRNTKWEQGRANAYILHGLPYDAGANPRINLPVIPDGQEVERITRRDFTTRYKAGPATFELMPWHRNAAGLPFSTEIFERAL
ncbi:unnamed protein product [Closterium sp. Yama58-4]|nr:unnamed protein product [Closterium sp. Yama58-4]